MVNAYNGILLVQLGAPEAATPDAVKEYLLSFLGDSHTLGNPPFFWQPLLRHIIAPLRCHASAAKYQEMLTQCRVEEMPLLTHTRAFAEGVAEHLKNQFPVAYAFQHGCKPSIAEALNTLASQGARHIRVIPLYPQRSDVTTGAVRDQVQTIVGASSQFHVEYLEGFWDRPAWVQSVVRSIQKCWDNHTHLLLSWHGIQEKRILAGDSYQKDCEMSSDRIGKALGISPTVTYQSKFGFAKWLGPSTFEVLKNLGKKQARVLVACPAFTVDNLETLYEIDVEAKSIFLKAGGVRFDRVPCLNGDPDWVRDFASTIAVEDLNAIS